MEPRDFGRSDLIRRPISILRHKKVVQYRCVAVSCSLFALWFDMLVDEKIGELRDRHRRIRLRPLLAGSCPAATAPTFNQRVVGSIPTASPKQNQTTDLYQDLLNRTHWPRKRRGGGPFSGFRHERGLSGEGRRQRHEGNPNPPEGNPNFSERNPSRSGTKSKSGGTKSKVKSLHFIRFFNYLRKTNTAFSVFRPDSGFKRSRQCRRCVLASGCSFGLRFGSSDLH